MHVTNQVRNMMFNFYDDLEGDCFDKAEAIKDFQSILEQVGLWEMYKRENNVIFKEEKTND